MVAVIILDVVIGSVIIVVVLIILSVIVGRNMASQIMCIRSLMV